MRCYGGTREDWLDVPLADLEGLAEEMGRIHAEASMELAEAMAAGTGAMKKQDLRRTWQRWKDAAGFKGKKRNASDSELAACGIKVVRNGPGRGRPNSQG